MSSRTVSLGLTCLTMTMIIVGCDDQPSAPPRGTLPDASLPFMKMADLELEKVLNAPGGTVAELRHLRGRVVVLEFWATWCVPCIEALPHLNEVARQCRDNGDPVVFISVTAEDEPTVRKFLADHPVEGWVGLDKPTDAPGVGATAKKFGVQGIPHTVVIDQHGFVVAHTWSSLITREGILNLTKSRPYPPGSRAGTPRPATQEARP